MNLIHKYYINNENFYNLNPLQSAVKFGIIFLQSNKTIAEPQNSTYLQLAHSTPKACFFMRNIRTPKEFADFVFIHQIYKSLSMVACSGKGSPFAVFQLSQFLRPLHVTAKASELYAVTLKCLQLELRKMYQFIFALSRAPQIKIRLLADTEQQARSRFTDGDTLLFVGRINQNPLKNNRTFSTNGKNHSLPKCEDAGSIESTTNESGKHNRYFSAIFLSKIHSLHVPKKLGTLSYIEFATRLRDRTKALSTNKIRRLSSVVDTLLHPITGDNSLLTKTRENPTMKIYPKNNRTLAALPTLSVSSAQGGANV
ncbi:host cell division inhibitor Icd-like protein [Haemophilus influenzae]|nr:host cell division inhibitor Icd-like protein [Haemophilus influenzae]